MKTIKKSTEFIEDCKTKFLQYLDNLKDGENINFKYDADTDIENIVKPKIIISKEAKNKMDTLIKKADGEIGWNGTVIRNGNVFTITDIYVYPQKVGATTVTCDEKETGDWLNTLPDEVFNNLRFQAHSHVNMGVSPSGTDTVMFNKYLETLDDDDFYIFMILNKKGDYYIEMYDKTQNIIFYKKDIEICIEGVEEFWEEASKQIKKEVPLAPANPYNYNKTEEKKQLSFKDCNKNCSTCKDFRQCATEYYKAFYLVN